ncbi:uncharacterized protein LOC130663695 [Microplitis mediator]|uniref:uncharacterized protein LOC130663695 n=1 Tax=Microplitis mediator TaxID=375433 RepID=UPI002555D2AB|nr:uncharacterized protein LOC130663695 [Microplitis mediator]
MKTVYHCLGSLVHERGVLTSAECLNRTSPFAGNTIIKVYGATFLNLETGLKLTNIHSISNVSYHDWQKEYNRTKLDYALLTLYWPIFFNNQLHLINSANESIIGSIDFENCILTSITRDKRKHIVPVECLYINEGNKLNCTSKDDEGGFYDSGSPVSCQLKDSRTLVLIGFISKYRRFLNEDGSRTLIPIYTSIIPVGQSLHYNDVSQHLNTIVNI